MRRTVLRPATAPCRRTPPGPAGGRPSDKTGELDRLDDRPTTVGADPLSRRSGCAKVESAWHSGTESARVLTRLDDRAPAPSTTWPTGASGWEPTTIRSTGSVRESRAVSRAASFVGPERGTAI